MRFEGVVRELIYEFAAAKDLDSRTKDWRGTLEKVNRWRSWGYQCSMLKL